MAYSILTVSSSQPDIEMIREACDSVSIQSVSDPDRAIELIGTDKNIKVVIVDFELCGPNAPSIFEKIKSGPSGKDLQILFLTRKDHDEDETEAVRLGSADCLVRPLSKEIVKARLDMHLELVNIRALVKNKKENQQLIEIFFLQAPVGIAIGSWKEPAEDEDSNILNVNPMYEKITGWSENELRRMGWMKITYPEDMLRETEKSRGLGAGDISSYSMDKRYVRPDGSLVWVHMIVTKVEGIESSSQNHVCIIQDITQRKEIEHALKESERSKAMLLSNFPGVAYRCDYDQYWTMKFISEGCYELTGYKPSDLLNNNTVAFSELILPRYRKGIWDRWEEVIAENKPFRAEYQIRTADGIVKWVWEMGQAIRDRDGRVIALEGIVLDISDRKKFEQELLYRNNHDAWTGLYNLNYLKKLLEVRQKENQAALISLDLSPMHSLSMIFGFQYSHNLIKSTTSELKKICHEDCQIFHAYEYRFIFYIRNYGTQNSLRQMCIRLSDTLESLLAKERVNWGLGVVELQSYTNSDVEHLLRYSMGASERALKDGHKAHVPYLFFDERMEAVIDREEKITEGMMEVASGSRPERLYLLFQPIVELSSDRIVSFEALARFESEHVGLVSPVEFIPIAEKTKLIIPLGKKIIKKSLEFLSSLKEEGLGSISISINISVIQLLHKDFIDYLLSLIDSMKIDHEAVIIEITESVFALDFERINSILNRLRETGIRIALDDFGTGYSSLARERELNVNFLKIDKLFIDKLLLLEDEQTITSDIISMGHKLGHSIVAEGVEHDRQRAYLERHGCDCIQGYLISRPLGETEALQFVREYAPGAYHEKKGGK